MKYVDTENTLSSFFFHIFFPIAILIILFLTLMRHFAINHVAAISVYLYISATVRS